MWSERDGPVPDASRACAAPARRAEARAAAAPRRVPALAVALALVVALWCGAGARAESVALVIGMAKYRHIAPLDNTVHDAALIADTLRGIGFRVRLVEDAGYADLRADLDRFAFEAETADLALIYFAGHGVEVEGRNFLVPADAKVRSNRDVQRQSVSLDDLLGSVDRARVMRIVILDSCRDNPFGDALDAERPAPGAAQDASVPPGPGAGAARAAGRGGWPRPRPAAARWWPSPPGTVRSRSTGRGPTAPSRWRSRPR